MILTVNLTCKVKHMNFLILLGENSHCLTFKLQQKPVYNKMATLCSRAHDNIPEIAQICKDYSIPHLGKSLKS